MESMKDVHLAIYDSLEKHCSELKTRKDNAKYSGYNKTLTLKSHSCFMRIYFGHEIKICIRTNTLNVQEDVCWVYSGAKTKVEDLNEYKKTTLAYLKNLIFMWENTQYCPEHHKKMIPDNAEEIFALLGDNHWSTLYERVMLYPCKYEEMDKLGAWLLIVKDPRFRRNIKPV